MIIINDITSGMKNVSLRVMAIMIFAFFSAILLNEIVSNEKRIAVDIENRLCYLSGAMIDSCFSLQ